MKRVIMALCIALLAACATTEGLRKLGKADEVVYEIPAEDLEDTAHFSGISFKPRRYECERNGYHFLRDAKISPKGSDRCEVSFVTAILPKGGEHSPYVAFKSYIFKVDRGTRNSVTTLQFKPMYEVLEPAPAVSRETISPPHTLEDALEVIATSGTVTFQFKVGSPRKRSVVLRNLRKYFKEETHVRQPVEVMKKRFKTSYLLQSSGNTIATFYPALTPHRKGTSVTVVAKVQLAADENYHIDSSDQAKDVKKLIIEAITE
jgi:hypothetical protein